MSRHLHAQVATRHHHAVGRFDDVLEVLHRLGAFDLRDQAHALAAVLVEETPQLAHALGVAHERGRYEVDILIDAEDEVGPILVGHHGQRHAGAGDVDGLALAQQPAVAHRAADVRAFDRLHPKLDEPVVQQDGLAGPDDARQPRAGLRDQLRRAVHHALGEHEGTALPQLHGTSARKRARADLGAASIQQDGARRAEVATHAFQQIHARPVFVVRAVREVETRHVHACGQQPAQGGLIVDGRSQRANDLRASCHAPPRSRPFHGIHHTVKSPRAPVAPPQSDESAHKRGVSERQRASKPPSDPRALREILRLACARPGWRTEIR